jgi:hypothetical protein
MPPFIRAFWLTIRAVPLYAGVVALTLGAFVWFGLHGTRLLGDDNESTETLNGPSGRTHGGSGHARFYHK